MRSQARRHERMCRPPGRRVDRQPAAPKRKRRTGRLAAQGSRGTVGGEAGDLPPAVRRLAAASSLASSDKEHFDERSDAIPSKSANVKNKDQYEALKDKGMSKERAAKIANSPKASKHGGEKSHSGSGKSNQGGTTAQHKAAGRKGGKAAAKKS